MSKPSTTETGKGLATNASLAEILESAGYVISSGTEQEKQETRGRINDTLNKWVSGLLFPDSGGVQSGGAGSKVEQHLLGHGTDFVVCGKGFESGADISKIGFITGGESDEHSS